jgi:hypothetical protein
MSDSPDNVVSFGGGGKLYADAREALEDQRRAEMLLPDPPPWADEPEPPHKAKKDKDGDKEPEKPVSVVTPKNLPEPVGEPGFDWRELFSTLLELTGITALSVAGWLVHPALGLAIIGIALILLGVATSKVMRG